MEPSIGHRDTRVAKTKATSSWPRKTTKNPHQNRGPAAVIASPKMPYSATIGEMNANANANEDHRLNSRFRPGSGWVTVALGCIHTSVAGVGVSRPSLAD